MRLQLFYEIAIRIFFGYITAETEEDLQKAYNIFKSEEFARYCALVGKNKSGGYVEVSTKAVKEFGVREEQPSVEN